MKARPNWTEALALTAMLSYLVAVVVFDVRVPGDVVFRPFVGRFVTKQPVEDA